VPGDGRQDLPTRRPELLEAGELRLDGEAGGRDGVDERTAVAENGAGDIRGPSPHPGPERGGMGVEAEDELRLAQGDTRGEGVAEEDQLSAP
jgi:hypothetical protein